MQPDIEQPDTTSDTPPETSRCTRCGREPSEDDGTIVGIPLGNDDDIDDPVCNHCLEEHIETETFLGRRESQAVAYKLLGKTHTEIGDLMRNREGDDAPQPNSMQAYYKDGVNKHERALSTYFELEPLLKGPVDRYDRIDAPTECFSCDQHADPDAGVIVNYALVVSNEGEVTQADAPLCNECIEATLQEETFLKNSERQAQIAAYELLGMTHSQVREAMVARFGEEAPRETTIQTHYDRARKNARRGLETFLVLEPLLEARRRMPQYQD